MRYRVGVLRYFGFLLRTGETQWECNSPWRGSCVSDYARRIPNDQRPRNGLSIPEDAGTTMTATSTATTNTTKTTRTTRTTSHWWVPLKFKG